MMSNHYDSISEVLEHGMLSVIMVFGSLFGYREMICHYQKNLLCFSCEAWYNKDDDND